MRLAPLVATIAMYACVILPGCQPQHGATTLVGDGAVLSPPAAVALLPAPPQGGTGAGKVVSNYTFSSTDVFTMEGGEWTGGNLSLDGPGLKYAILGALAGGQQIDAVALDGTASGLWLGVGDYGRGVWRWVAGPLDAPGQYSLPAAGMLNADGYMYIALVCPAGASCDVQTTLVVSEPGAVVTLGPDLVGESITPLLGVNCGPYHAGDTANPDLVAEYAALGVNYVRTHDFLGPLDLAVMYPDRSADPLLAESYDFTESDKRWQMILDCGAEPYLRLGDSATNATPPADLAERANMGQAAVEIVKHYRLEQWAGFSTAFRYVEIWSEPDGALWPGHSALEFILFYVETARALKDSFPELQVGGAGFSSAAYLTAPGKQYVVTFLEYMEANSVPLDFISWHMYSNSPLDYSTAAAWYREQLDSHSFSAAQSHLTEYNTSDTDLPPGDVLQLRTGPRGASLLSAVWIALQGAPLDLAALYRGNDLDSAVPSYYGMHYADGQPKKIAQAFALWHMLCGSPDLVQAVAATPGGGTIPLWVIAGRSGNTQAALVVNPGDVDTTYSLAFSDGSFPGDYAVTVREVSATLDGSAQSASDGILVPIPGYGVQLVVTEPN